MRVILFQSRFAAPIRAGVVTQTLRARPASNPHREGEELSLREWSGPAYRSPQREIVPPVLCSRVRPAAVSVQGPTPVVYVAGARLTPEALWAFVAADGFESPEEFRAYWRGNGVLTWRGDLIEWEPPAPDPALPRAAWDAEGGAF